MLMISGALAGAWAFLAPWLGPVVAVAFPVLSRLRASVGGWATLVGPLAGVALVALAIGIGAWKIHDRREALRAEGETRCVTKVAEVTLDELKAEQDRRQRAELAANTARDEARAVETAFAARVADLEGELAVRPPKGLCYPADIARRLNQ